MNEVLLASTPRRKIALSPRPLGEGGQATVFGVDADPSLAIKLYHEPTEDIERRLESMLLLARPEQFLSEDGAGHPALTWPSAMVEDPSGGTVIGYAMRRVGAPDFVLLGTLFDPAQRRAHFADVSWRFVVGVARNLAALIAALHERDLILGDISHGNLVVNARGYLSFLDCDSMQFTDPRSGEFFPCLFLTPEYAPAELHSDDAMERSAASDDFSLAVLVCRLLLLGDHPFMGIRLAGDEDADIASNIADGYCHLVRPEEMGLPPGRFDPGLLPPPVLQLARRAFGPGHLDRDARPTAAAWFSALDDAMRAIAGCGANPHHAYSDHLPRCPWCARIEAGASDAFPGPRVAPPSPPAAPPARRTHAQRRRADLLPAIAGLFVLALLVLLVVL